MKLIRYEYPQALVNGAYDTLFDSAAPAMGRFGSLFDDLFGSSTQSNQTAANLYEDEHNYYARLELPGVKKEAIDLELEKGVLTIANAQAAEGGEAKQSFRRSIKVPEGVAMSKISASHQDGILTVTMPKEEARKPRQIEVN